LAREPTARPQPFSRYEILINTFGCPLYLQKRGTRHKQHQNDGKIHIHFDLAELQRQHHHLTMIVNKGTTQTSAKARSSYITHIQHVAKYYTVYIYIYLHPTYMHIYMYHICTCTYLYHIYITYTYYIPRRPDPIAAGAGAAALGTPGVGAAGWGVGDPWCRVRGEVGPWWCQNPGKMWESHMFYWVNQL